MDTIFVKNQEALDAVDPNDKIKVIIDASSTELISIFKAYYWLEIKGQAVIQYVSGSATIQSVSGSATIVVACGNSIVIVDDRKIKVKTKHNAQMVYRSQERYPIGAKDFADIMGLTVTKDSVCLFKSVKPEDHTDFYTGKIKYEGVVDCSGFDPDPTIQCGKGLHLSPTPEMALSYNQGKVLKCRVALNDIAVFSGDLTKVRCRRVKVIGEHKQGE